MSHLPLVGSIGIHHPNIEHRRSNQVLLQQRDIVPFLFFALRMIGAIDDLLAVIRPERAAVVTKFIRQPLHVLTIRIHRVDVQITITLRSEHQLALPIDGRLSVVTGRRRQSFEIRSVRVRGEDIERVIDRPHIALREIRTWWTLLRAEVRG